MRNHRALWAVLAATALALWPGLAGAEEQFDVTVAKSEISVVTKGPWHINQDYPWKVIAAGGETLDKSHFHFTELSAHLAGVPHGTAKLKGAVCSGPQCMPFTKDVVIE